MSVADALRHARALIAGGWSEPMSTTADGAFCTLDDEGLVRFCVADALAHACRGRCAFGEAEEKLKGVIVPAWSAREQLELHAGAAPTDELVQAWLTLCRARGAAYALGDWLQHPKRTLTELLHGFSLAVLRAKAQQEAV